MGGKPQSSQPAAYLGSIEPPGLLHPPRCMLLVWLVAWYCASRSQSIQDKQPPLELCGGELHTLLVVILHTRIALGLLPINEALWLT